MMKPGGECTHDLVYKCKNKLQRAELEELSKCLATQTQAAGMIADIMFDKSRGTVGKEEEELPVGRSKFDVLQTDAYNKLEKRIKIMSKSENAKEEFNGLVDSLI